MRTWFPPVRSIPGDFSTPEPNPDARPLPPITHHEITAALKDTSNTSAPGVSGMNYKVLKWARDCCVDEFDAIIQASVSLGIHHPSWKSAIVVAVPKPNKKDYSLPRAHRPVQLLECFGKLVEKVVAKRLLFEAGKFELMPFTQFGGRSHASCLDAALSLTHNIESARHKQLVSSFLAIDIKGFFDYVNHDRMIKVLQAWPGFAPAQ